MIPGYGHRRSRVQTGRLRRFNGRYRWLTARDEPVPCEVWQEASLVRERRSWNPLCASRSVEPDPAETDDAPVDQSAHGIDVLQPREDLSRSVRDREVRERTERNRERDRNEGHSVWQDCDGPICQRLGQTLKLQ